MGRRKTIETASDLTEDDDADYGAANGPADGIIDIFIWHNAYSRIASVGGMAPVPPPQGYGPGGPLLPEPLRTFFDVGHASSSSVQCATVE